MLKDFIPKARKEDNFKQTIVNKCLYKLVKQRNFAVNLARSKNFTPKIAMTHIVNNFKFTLTSPDGKPHTDIDHILTGRTKHSNLLHARSSRAADRDSDH